MAEPNEELGRAVQDVLQRMHLTSDTAATVLGMNSRTLDAMCRGIAPMRSLIIRFAEGVARHSTRDSEAPEWWRDVDAWLRLAGHAPRREPAVATATATAPEASDPSPRPKSDGDADPPAREFYRPVYQRMPWRDTIIHVFGIVNAQGETIFRRNFRPDADYRAEAESLKRDLANMNKTQFERKYHRYRVSSEAPR